MLTTLKTNARTRGLVHTADLRVADLQTLIKMYDDAPPVATLKAEAKRKGVVGYSRMRKPELVHRLSGLPMSPSEEDLEDVTTALSDMGVNWQEMLGRHLHKKDARKFFIAKKDLKDEETLVLPSDESFTVMTLGYYMQAKMDEGEEIFFDPINRYGVLGVDGELPLIKGSRSTYNALKDALDACKACSVLRGNRSLEKLKREVPTFDAEVHPPRDPRKCIGLILRGPDGEEWEAVLDRRGNAHWTYFDETEKLWDE